MTLKEREDFLRGYADAEEKLLDANFDLKKALSLLVFAMGPYEKGWRMCLQEESDRLEEYNG